MAPSVWSNVLICLVVANISVHTSENISTGSANSSAATEQNSSYSFTEIYPTTELDTSPTQRSSGPSEQPAEAAAPLPVSGSLSSAVAGAARLCPCDQLPAGCDVNCCCDRDCEAEVALFTRCSVRVVRSGSQQLCSQEVARYSLSTAIDGYSQLQASVQEETNHDFFCIQAQNRGDGLAHPSPPLPTHRSFDSLFSQFSSFMFGSEHHEEQPPAEVWSSSGYQFGDVLATAEPNGHRGTFYLPAAGLTADCVKSPAGFLQDRSSRCSQRLAPGGACGSLEALRMDTYSSIQLLAAKDGAAAVVPVDVASVVLQSMDGALTQLTGEGPLLPEAVGPSLCSNVVLKVVYVIQFNRAGRVQRASVSLVLGLLNTADASLLQEFQVLFNQDGGERAVHYSGNPGYVFGSALMSGHRAADGISRSLDLRDTLTTLHSHQDQDCLRGPHRRAPLRFGLDFMSGCTLSLEDVTNCSLLSQQLLEVLRGPTPPQFVASFGNSPLENLQDWVPIRTTIQPTEEGSCIIPLSLHLEIEWTKYGSLQNPQAQIVKVREVIETNRSSLAPPPAGSSILPIRSSVAFIPVSAAALPGYRATPTIDAKLPFDFFFPFV